MKDEAIARLRGLIQDINPAEIADHLLFESLTDWTESWRREAMKCIEEIDGSKA